MTATAVFDTTGAFNFIVPTGVTSVTATLVGGQGGTTHIGTGLPGRVQATITVVPHQVIVVNVAGNGISGGGTSAGKTGGGNGGGNANPTASGSSGGSGGGASDLTISGVRVLVAAGGGGESGGGKVGGNGGGATGQTGTDAGVHGLAGHGGAAASGGAGGAVDQGGCDAGTNGSADQGGSGGRASGGLDCGGGGGGGGLFGGGGGGGGVGAGAGGGGGGGSNFIAATVNGVAPSATTNTQGSGATPCQVVLTYNIPPNQPVLVSPPNNTNADADADLIFDWNFNDPDLGDTQGSADFQWRIGTGAWNLVANVATTVSQYTSLAGSWTPYVGQLIEWQVRTTDAEGAQGPWSDSRFFTPRHEPAAATITPTPVIDSQTPTLAWTTPSGMVAYQAQVLLDSGGSPTGAPLADTGEVDVTGVPTAGSIALPDYAYNPADEYHLLVRWQQYSGVWSDYADSGALVVNINAPLQPTVVLIPSPDTASITVVITNPGSDPFPPVYNDIYRTDLDNGGDEIRVAHSVDIGGTWTDWMPASKTRYQYRVVAVSATGSFTSSG